MGEATFDYDESEWPIVRIVSPVGVVNDAELSRNLQRMTEYLQRRQPLAFIIELDPGTNLSVEQRDEIRRHEEQHRALIGQFQRGVAIVTHSTFQRAMINAIIWMIRSVSPTRAFSDVESAKGWARTLLGPHPAKSSGPA